MNNPSQKSATLTGGERIGVACAGMMSALLVGACAAVAISFLGTLGSLVMGVALGGFVGACGLYWFAVATGLGRPFGLITGGLLTATGLFGVFPSLDYTGGPVILLAGLLLVTAITAMLTDSRRSTD